MSGEDRTLPEPSPPGDGPERQSGTSPAGGDAAPPPPPPADPQTTVEQGDSDVRRARNISSNPTIEMPTLDRQRPGSDEADFAAHCRAVHPLAPAVPDYYPVRKLGQGTFGQVWLYQQEHTHRRVAIKFLTQRVNIEWQLLQAEVKQLALLDGDPGIVQLRDVEPDATPPYYVMTFAEGGSLADRLERGPLTVAEALRIGTQVARALAYVHAKGVRHCDLKPGNVLLDARGRALVADFGQAHLASDLSPALGTFFYMAPEQADLKEMIPDTRWDVYGLGALLYAMLTGQPPRADAKVRDELAATASLDHRLRRYRDHLLAAPPPHAHHRLKGVDRHLADIVDRCLVVEPDQRFHDAGAVLEALERRQRILRHRPVLLFGLLAPVLLLLGLGALGRWVLKDTLERSEAALVAQMQSSDLAAARLIANVVEDELADRKQFIEQAAGAPEFRAAVATGRPTGVLNAFLADFQRRRARQWFDAWFLADARGRLVAYHSASGGGDEVIGANFRWRDWFHGGGDRFDDRDGAFAALRRTHVSQPYLGKVRLEGLAIALATPVFPPGGDGEPIGVLAARFPVRSLHGWLENVRVEHGFVVLVNERRHVLLHRDAEAIAPADGREPVAHSGCELFDRLLDDREPGSGRYVDPVDGAEYLVSHAPLAGRLDRGLRWGALVQHHRARALQPVEDLRRRMRLVGLMTVGASLLATFGLWGWLIVTLRREEAPSHG